MSGPRVDVSDLADAVAFLREELGKPGTPLAHYFICRNNRRGVCKTDPATGKTTRVSRYALSADIAHGYEVVKVRRGKEVPALFPTAAISAMTLMGNNRA